MVKPPNTPVVSNKYTILLCVEYFAKRAYTTPNRKHPKRFTTSVPHGNALPAALFTNVDIEYLNTPPIKLPIPTNNNDFIIP